MTGNCLKGARPIMSFDKSFDEKPHLKLLKEMILQVFGSPRNHPRSKPFVDHVFSWFVVDSRVWFRNYQVCVCVCVCVCVYMCVCVCLYVCVCI